MNVSALDGATNRVIGGSLSASPAGGTVGVTAALMVNKDKAEAKIGDWLEADKVNNVIQKADVKGSAQVFTGSAGLGALSQTGSNTFTATLNLIKIDSDAKAAMGKNAKITSTGKVSVTSGTKLDLTSVGVNASVSIAGLDGGGMAAGSTMILTRDEASAKTEIFRLLRLRRNRNRLLRNLGSDDFRRGFPGCGIQYRCGLCRRPQCDLFRIVGQDHSGSEYEYIFKAWGCGCDGGF